MSQFSFGQKYILGVFIVLLLFVGCSGDENQAKNDDTAVVQCDICDLVQLAVDFEQLQKFLHPDVEGREELCITGLMISKEIEIFNNGKYVRVVESLEECDNVIRFDTINIDSDSANMVFFYPIEGVRGKIGFELVNNNWAIVSSEIAEI
jgi:hypothetical protein